MVTMVTMVTMVHSQKCAICFRLWDESRDKSVDATSATRTDRRSSNQTSMQIEACRSAGKIAGLGVATMGYVIPYILIPRPAPPAPAQDDLEIDQSPEGSSLPQVGAIGLLVQNDLNLGAQKESWMI